MTYGEFQRQIGKAGLSIRAFAELIRMNNKSVSNYAKREVPSHLAVIAVLLAELSEQKIDFRAVLSNIDIESKKPRGAGIVKFGGNKQARLF